MRRALALASIVLALGCAHEPRGEEGIERHPDRAHEFVPRRRPRRS